MLVAGATPCPCCCSKTCRRDAMRCRAAQRSRLAGAGGILGWLCCLVCRIDAALRHWPSGWWLQVGEFLVPRVTGRWLLLMLTVGGLLARGRCCTSSISVVSSTSLAAVLLNLYRGVGKSPERHSTDAIRSHRAPCDSRWRRLVGPLVGSDRHLDRRRRRLDARRAAG